MTSDALEYLGAVFKRSFRLLAAPGGSSRKTALYQADGMRVALSRRRSEGRARLEAEVLAVLGAAGLAPKLLHHSGCFVVQEAVAGDRLPIAMARRGQDAQDLMRTAWRALAKAQALAEDAGLGGRVPEIGARPGWVEDLTAAPARLGAQLGLEVPGHAFGDLLTCEPSQARFVKWDARPGNAMLRPDGSVCWFDWEHAGRRRPLDDAVWLFADEWAPDVEGCADLVVETLFPDPSDAQRKSVLLQYDAMAVAHGCMRLELIFRHKGEGRWWSFDQCLRQDRIGVTALHVRLLCARLVSHARRVEGLRALAPFFDRVAAQARDLRAERGDA